MPAGGLTILVRRLIQLRRIATSAVVASVARSLSGAFGQLVAGGAGDGRTIRLSEAARELRWTRRSRRPPVANKSAGQGLSVV
jgi:hypothetical protein